VPADLVAEVLTGDAEGAGAGWLQDIPVQVIPLVCVGQRIGGGHISTASTPVPSVERGGVKESIETLGATVVASACEPPIPFWKHQKTLMKHLLVATTALLLPTALHAQEPLIKCPGKNTVEMRYCASKSLEQSESQLRKKVSKHLMQQWQDATRSVCAAAYAPYKDGTIYPQLVVGCDDNLNRALLKEFKPMNAR
jgi:hypothetical protein